MPYLKGKIDTSKEFEQNTVFRKKVEHRKKNKIMINANEVKKDLYKSKNLAKFTQYISGNLYYTVELSDGTYQFPIATVEKTNDVYQLSEDLGSTSFTAEIKGSDLNRWISKAIEKGEFIKIG